MRIPISLTLSLLSAASFAASAQVQEGPTAADWKEDIKLFATKFPALHVKPFHKMTRAEFDAAINRLLANIDTMTQDQRLCGLQAITAAIGDSHTGINRLPPALGRRNFRFKLTCYADGVFVETAAPECKHLLGAKLLAVERMPISKVLPKLLAVTEGTTMSGRRADVSFRFGPDTLHGVGISKSLDGATFRFEKDGKIWDEKATPLPRGPKGPIREGFFYFPGVAPGSNWLDAASGSKPLYLQNWDKPFTPTFLSKEGIYYIQCNEVENDGGSFSDRFLKAYAEAEKLPIKKFVIDLRLNGGGNNELLPPVIQALAKSSKLNKKGVLFAIIGGRTQSAAQNFTNQLQLHTNVTFVGDPTGESPNHYGDPVELQLPKTGIVIHISSIRWHEFPDSDKRNQTTPDIPAPLTFAQYRQGRDPAMEAIIRYPRKPKS
ncbi:MAG: hypothetical protein JSS72_04205 [Armatimonadetes bacterium]|nr:hypothetical protein [Armatimonadota bacterium]